MPRSDSWVLAATVSCEAPSRKDWFRPAMPVAYEPPPTVKSPAAEPEKSFTRVVMTLTTAPWRDPPNSAGNAPVNTSSESISFGSMISEKFELVLCASGTPSIS